MDDWQGVRGLLELKFHDTRSGYVNGNSKKQCSS